MFISCTCLLAGLALVHGQGQNQQQQQQFIDSLRQQGFTDDQIRGFFASQQNQQQNRQPQPGQQQNFQQPPQGQQQNFQQPPRQQQQQNFNNSKVSNSSKGFSSSKDFNSPSSLSK
eukprot:TRINITY_DN4957_c0_g1_i5.p2 TRINITY_DN4957_c0_g1~~TRINITY_DN4957_c0_g1_i5.p2  ORF type:complete len:116 (-),score=36.78 TRINITY_DN4957_c0_g1_i5:267-614(-)